MSYKGVQGNLMATSNLDSLPSTFDLEVVLEVICPLDIANTERRREIRHRLRFDSFCHSVSLAECSRGRFAEECSYLLSSLRYKKSVILVVLKMSHLHTY